MGIIQTLMSEEVDYKTLLTDSGLPEEYVDHLATERGVDDLWNPQVQALEEGILTDENFLVVSEAGTGKTLLAEFVMLQQSIMTGGCGVFLVPFKPLADEKETEFSEALGDKLGLSVDSSIGSDISPPHELFANDIVISTYEKFSYYLRNHPEAIEQKVGTVIIDEFQTLNDRTRGSGLEITVTKLLHDYNNIKLVGLSATTANVSDIAEWLNGSFVNCQGWRPVPLHEGLYAVRDHEITFYHKSSELENESCEPNLLDNVRDNAVARYLLSHSNTNKRQAMVFSPTRRDAQKTAEKIAEFAHEHPKSYDFGIDEPAVDELRAEIDQAARRTSKTIKSLKTCIRWGTAFYHAGLNTDVRTVIERGFKQGSINMIASTSNLGAGINLPVDRIYIQYPRYGSEYSGNDMSTAQYKNLVGRAGRPNYESQRGESVIFAEEMIEESRYKNKYISGDLEPIESQIDITEDLDLLLDIVREYQTPQQVYSFLDTSLFGVEQNLTKNKVQNIIDNIGHELEKYEMIVRTGDGISLTDLGKKTSKELIEPETAHRIRSYLLQAAEDDTIETEVLLAVMCGTPEFKYMRLWHDRKQTNLNPEKLSSQLNLQHLSANDVGTVYTTASVVTDWLGGDSIEEAFSTYSVTSSRTPADVYERLSPELSRVLRTVTRIIEVSDPEIHEQFSTELNQLATQLKYGLDEEGVEFAKAKIATSRSDVRALRNKIGIETIDELAACEIGEMAKRMPTSDAVNKKRKAIKHVYEGSELVQRDILLDVVERGLSEPMFKELFNTHTENFENVCLNLLSQVDTLFVNQADEEGQTEEPEAWVKIKQPDGNYVSTDDGETLEIAVECKSKKSQDKKVTASEAVAVSTKAPESNVKLTIGTPEFVDRAEDSAIKNDVSLMPVAAFAAFVCRAINREIDRQMYIDLLSQRGIIDVEKVRSVIDHGS